MDDSILRGYREATGRSGATSGIGTQPTTAGITHCWSAAGGRADTFGHADFRGLQAGVIGELLAGRSALAVLPTGGGKSLCYQIPSPVRPGLGPAISPLIALMAEQVAALQQSGVAAKRLDSTTSLEARGDISRRISDGTLDLLYLSPEGLMQPSMLERLDRVPLALVAIDEALCVSRWGHDFRPE